ncbi:MAG TPA: hypothetical protein VFV33_13005 [Gemmatimonadaceae bacterium]|nr:hypothetical protein [Gemmatimonadaceae bacterium]
MTDPLALLANAAASNPSFVPVADRHPGCGGVFTSTTITKTESMVGLTATVERRVLRCSKCELERRAPDHVEGDYLATMAAIRETHGLLTHQEIRRIREALGVTSEEFDQLLGLPTGISKGWETQRHLQNRQADARIRVLQDVEQAKVVAAGARVTLRLTEEERAAFKPPAFLRKKGGAAISAEVEVEVPLAPVQAGGRGTPGTPGSPMAPVADLAPGVPASEAA